VAAQIDSLTLSFVEATVPPELATCYQAYVINAASSVSGLINNGPFSTSIKFLVEIEITPVLPVFYSRGGYFEDYHSSTLDNAGVGEFEFLGQFGTSQSDTAQIITPTVDTGNGTGFQVVYGFLGIPEVLLNSNPVVYDRLYLGPGGGVYFWMNTPTSRDFSVECFYRIHDNITGYGDRVSVGTFSQNLPVLGCEPTSDSDCPCDWSAISPVPGGTWTPQTGSCAEFTLAPLPTTTWTKRGCP
jgi:hypothetical protein